MSASEQLLFGGPLLYDTGWSSHDGAFTRLGLWSMVATLPRLIRTTVRLAAEADRGALRLVAAAEIGRGAAQAVGLVAVNTVLAALLAGGEPAGRLREALPALAVVAVTALVAALLTAASTYGSGRLEPKVERVATERYLARASRVELAAIEDDQFHRLLDTAQYGAASARRMIDYCIRVVNALLSLIAAAGVLTVLHPVLLPLLALMTVPSMWSTLITTRRRYCSFRTWVQHARAGRVLSSELTATETAAEIRVHQVGPFLLKHFRAMSASAEAEQTRLARLDARTGLWASAWTGLAGAATYLTLGALAWTGVMAMSVAGTAVLAIRTGSASLGGMVQSVNNLYDESLFVADLDQLCVRAAQWAIPEGGAPVPARPGRITFEDVTFRYPGTEAEPALSGVSLTIPVGRVTALVGENGSGKSTLVKLLAGLYLPESGRVCWDGVPTSCADRRQIFDRIAMVAQDFNRWRFTARVNIAIGAPGIPVDDERLRAAARDAGADSVIESLPRGWDTLLARGYQNGCQLSGGQWQRLGIARAHYRDAPVLIVDEPTAALDAKEEQRVFDQIRDLADAGQTVVLITHRMASVRHADLVHVLHQGRLTESGSPQELLARRGGRFRELYGIQAAQFGRPVGSGHLDGAVPGR
ncbi:ABC transporter ATP-binding protein [Streptomyces marincola]|uniref:ABC transporter ATP-binding protein n=1 Tax=Streptomyces marincola TaxID=2878388 RepID=UPI001CF232D9|nr:ABC transporter ATP-binding protein [Streptomyces marincola]UCM91985.1 ABC transporter ATP-binding protein/permease [Streptomyces marincola]